jgi:hypothetical protein
MKSDSKLDVFVARLDDMLASVKDGGQGLSYAEAIAELRKDGFGGCSPSTLCAWWQARQREKIQERLLGQIASGARQCQEVERELGKSPPPDLETLIKLHRVLVMKLSTQANVDPSLFKALGYLMKPVLEFAKLQEKRAARELDETKWKESLRKKLESGLDAVADAFKANSQAMELYQQAREMISQNTQ